MGENGRPLILAEVSQDPEVTEPPPALTLTHTASYIPPVSPVGHRSILSSISPMLLLQLLLTRADSSELAASMTLAAENHPSFPWSHSVSLWLPSTPQWAGTSATLHGGAGEPRAVNKCQPDLHGNHLVHLLLSAYNSILKQFSSPNGRLGSLSSAARPFGGEGRGVASRFADSLLLFSLREDQVKKQQLPLESCDNHCACGLECAHVRAVGKPPMREVDGGGCDHNTRLYSVLFRNREHFLLLRQVALLWRMHLRLSQVVLRSDASNAELAFKANRRHRLSPEWWEVAVERGCNGRVSCRLLPVIL